MLTNFYNRKSRILEVRNWLCVDVTLASCKSGRVMGSKTWS